MLKKLNHTHLAIGQFISAVLLIILFTLQFVPFWTFTSTGQAFVKQEETAVKPEDKTEEKSEEEATDEKADEAVEKEAAEEQAEQIAELVNETAETETAVQVIGDGKAKAKSVSINSYVWFPYNNADLETYFSEIMSDAEKQKRFDAAVKEANTVAYINGYLKDTSLTVLFEKVVEGADQNSVIFKAENDEIIKIEGEITPVIEDLKKTTEESIKKIEEDYAAQINPLEEAIKPQVEAVEEKYQKEIDAIKAQEELKDEEKSKQVSEKEKEKQAEIDALRSEIIPLEDKKAAEIDALNSAQTAQINTLKKPVKDIQAKKEETKKELKKAFANTLASEKYVTAFKVYREKGYINKVYADTLKNMHENEIDIIKINEEYRNNLGLEKLVVEAMTETIKGKGLIISDEAKIPALLKSNNATFINAIDTVVTKSVTININKIVKIPVIMFFIFVAAIGFACLAIFMKKDWSILSSLVAIVCAVVCYLQYKSHFAFDFGVNVKAHLAICVLIMVVAAITMILRGLLFIKDKKA